MGEVNSPSIVAVIVTYRRTVELKRLLRCLEQSDLPLQAVVISDHSPTGEVTALGDVATIPVRVLEDASNPGPGGGWANAAARALLDFPQAEAIWYLDDDVVFPPETLGILWREMQKAGAEAIAPLLAEHAGNLWAFPEPMNPTQRKTIRQARTPQAARELLGDEPLPFCWCTGACFLVSRSAVEQYGLHRRDFWILGEDLEYSMRVASGDRAVFTCQAVVPHLPPNPPSPEAARRGDYVKFCSLLQNLSYLSFHTKHSRHMSRYLPGNFRRFLATHGWNGHTLRDAAGCFWDGVIRGEPAGSSRAAARRKRIAARFA